MRTLKVVGHAEVVVSTLIRVPDDAELDDEEIFERASKQFSGIENFAGNGGMNKLIGVEGYEDAIQVVGPVVFDDYM